MPRLKVDGIEVEVGDGATVLEAARVAGVAVPTLCYLVGRAAHSSCMVCVVKVVGRRGLVPSCAMPAAEGMVVESETPEVRAARREALELLLSDHLGDCEGPCQSACPAGMEIPLMIRQIAAGEMAGAIATVKRDIALPAVLGRICPAPCEKACRRGQADGAVGICLLKRYVADADLAGGQPWAPPCAPETGRRVAIVGAGPAGLAGAYYLRQFGHCVTVFEARQRAGGGLREVEAGRLGAEMLDAEIATIERLGIAWRFGVRVGTEVSWERLAGEFDSLLIAMGAERPGSLPAGMSADEKGIAADRRTQATGAAGVFAGGDAVRQRRLAVAAVAQGKRAAISIDEYLNGREATGGGAGFTVHMGRLEPEELEQFMGHASGAGRVEPGGLKTEGKMPSAREEKSEGGMSLAREEKTEGGMSSTREEKTEGKMPSARGYTAEEAVAEAGRCLHCDCRKGRDCRLREYAAQYGARARAYAAGRRRFEEDWRHERLVYEPGKCISCGICVTLAAEAGEELGLTFVGRGFDVRVAAPWGADLAAGLEKAAEECVRHCPTGAMAWKEKSKVKS